MDYLIGILDSIEIDNATDFDTDEFAEMMSAYLPGFDNVEK